MIIYNLTSQNKHLWVVKVNQATYTPLVHSGTCAFCYVMFDHHSFINTISQLLREKTTVDFNWVNYEWNMRGYSWPQKVESSRKNRGDRFENNSCWNRDETRFETELKREALLSWNRSQSTNTKQMMRSLLMTSQARVTLWRQHWQL